MNYSYDPYSTTTPTTGNYSPQYSTTYYTGSTPSGKQNLSYNSSDYYYYYQYYSTPSLYSKEEHANMIRKKEKLKADIISLRQTYKQLKSEEAKLKQKKVSNAELALIQAETKDESSKTNTLQLQNYVSDLFEQTHEAAAAKAFVSVFSQEIKDEEKKRKYYIDEANAVANLFDFSDLQMQCPPLKWLNQKPQSSLKEEYNIEERQLRRMNNELVTLECPSKLSPIQVDAANCIVKKTELECKLSTVGLQILKADVHHLQKVLEEQEMNFKKRSDENEKIRRKLKGIEIETGQIESNMNSLLLTNEETYKQECQKIDNEILEINQKIEQTAEEYEHIENSIRKIKTETEFAKIQIRNHDSIIAEELFGDDLQEEQSETEYEYEYEDNDEENREEQSRINQEKEGYMKIEKLKLSCEVEDLKRKLESTKKALKLRENRLKKRIQRLYLLYSSNKKRVKTDMITSDSSSSNVQDDIANIINHIEDSINILKSGVAEI